MDFINVPAAKYGGAFLGKQPATSDETTLNGVAPVPTHGLGGALAPSEPLFWAGIIIATAVGCMAYSTIHKL